MRGRVLAGDAGPVRVAAARRACGAAGQVRRSGVRCALKWIKQGGRAALPLPVLGRGGLDQSGSSPPILAPRRAKRAPGQETTPLPPRLSSPLRPRASPPPRPPRRGRGGAWRGCLWLGSSEGPLCAPRTAQRASTPSEALRARWGRPQRGSWPCRAGGPARGDASSGSCSASARGGASSRRAGSSRAAAAAGVAEGDAVLSLDGVPVPPPPPPPVHAFLFPPRPSLSVAAGRACLIPAASRPACCRARVMASRRAGRGGGRGPKRPCVRRAWARMPAPPWRTSKRSPAAAASAAPRASHRRQATPPRPSLHAPAPAPPRPRPRRRLRIRS